MGRLFRKVIDFLTLNFFYPLSYNKVPKWVLNASDKYEMNTIRPYNKIIFLKGKKNVYKVLFKAVAQGQIEVRYYSKRKTF